MRRSLSIILLACATSITLPRGPLPGGGIDLGPTVSLAAENWKAEFDTVCSKTDTAMTLSAAELKELIARCDQLKPKIEAEDGSTRKVYLRRLKMCRDLYLYVLDSKEHK